MIAPELNPILRQVQRPARYVGGEWNAVVRPWSSPPGHVALVYPDLYEVGMASLPFQTLYRNLNEHEGVAAERAFAPWGDMANAQRAARVPLAALESSHPLADFEVLLFVVERTLQFTGVLECLDLAGLPLRAMERRNGPLVVACGRSIRNWEALAPYFDLFLVGDSEAILPQVLKLLQGTSERGAFLTAAAKVPGCYVPSLTTLAETEPIRAVRLAPALSSFVVPNMEVATERAAIEVLRACEQCEGCRNEGLCTAALTHTVAEVLECVEAIRRRSGHREIALVGSPAAKPQLYVEIARAVRGQYLEEELNLSIPALEADRLDEAELLAAAAEVLRLGFGTVRLAFQLGRPGESTKVPRIEQLVQELARRGQSLSGQKPKLRVEVSWFIPRPGTALERRAQLPLENLQQIHEELRKRLRRMGTHLSSGDPEQAFVEAVLVQGDRSVAPALESAWRARCLFPAVPQHFSLETWLEAFRAASVDPESWARRPKSEEETLPWATRPVPAAR